MATPSTNRPSGSGEQRRRVRLRPADRALPRRAARPLLPDARLGARRRGRAPGGAAARLARAGALRGPQLAALVALHDRHQHLPERDRAAAQARAADRLRAGLGSPRRASGCRRSSRPGSSPTRTRGSALEDGYAAPEARYELRESVELAFVAALQNLPANQRAALILREVLGFSAARGRPRRSRRRVASVNSALQRARKTVDEQAPRAEPAGDAARARRRQAARDRRGLHGRDGAAATSTRWSAMLAEDAAWSMPPLPGWFTRPRGAARLHGVGPLSGEWRWRHLPTRANGQPAVASYAWYEPDERLPAVRDRRVHARGRRGIKAITRSSTARRSAARTSSTSATPSSRWTSRT